MSKDMFGSCGCLAWSSSMQYVGTQLFVLPPFESPAEPVCIPSVPKHVEADSAKTEAAGDIFSPLAEHGISVLAS